MKIQGIKDTQIKIISIVDQCHRDQTACYGWLLCLSNGEALAQCQGVNLGPSSGPRAAAWGLLSVTTFLEQLSKFHHTIPNLIPDVTILSRNSKIIKYLRSRPNYPTLFCNATLANNWDVLEQTHVTKTRSQIQIVWDTVPEYRLRCQKTEPPPVNLDQSILDTREITMNYIRQNPRPQPISPFLPASRCMLYSETYTVHEAYNIKIREAATIPTLKNYLQGKHNWDNPTTESIQWEWFKQAIRSYKTASANHLTKL